MKWFLFIQYFQSITLNNLCRFNQYKCFCVIIKIRECFQRIDACSQCRRFLYGHLMSLYHCGGLLVEEPNSSFTVSTRDFIISATLKTLDILLYQNVINKNEFCMIYKLWIFFDINWAGLITRFGNLFCWDWYFFQYYRWCGIMFDKCIFFSFLILAIIKLLRGTLVVTFLSAAF